MTIKRLIPSTLLVLAALSSAAVAAELPNYEVKALPATPHQLSVVGAVPQPGCFCFGGIPYWFTLSTLLLRLSAGVPVFSEDVFVSAHTTNWLEV